jgi:hypothetical protein
VNRRAPGHGLRRAFCVIVLLAGACAVVAAQGSPGDSGDLDNLFNQDGTTAPAGGSPAQDPGTQAGQGATADQAPAVNAPAAPPDLRPDDPTRDQKIHYFGSLDIYGLLGIGWAKLPDPGDLRAGLGNEGSGSLAATLGVDIRPTPELRLSATMSYSFPRVGTQLSELIVDYSILNSVFFRIGIYDTTWGVSQFFQFSNLPSRSLPDWGVTNEPLWQQTNIITKTPQQVLPVSGKVDIPIGLSNLTFLARFDMANYGFPDNNAPDPRYAGFGIHYDIPTGPVEWSVAGFYQYLLDPRASLGMKTSLLGFDFSVESTLAFPVSLSPDRITWRPTAGGGIPVGSGQRIYPTVVAGLSREWPDARIKFYGEYAFNGERDAGVSWVPDATGPGGHNSAMVLRFGNVLGSSISLNALWQQNWSDGSGLVSTLLEFSPARLATLQLGPVLVYGPDNSEVINNRLVPGNKRLEFLVLLKVGSTYRQ